MVRVPFHSFALLLVLATNIELADGFSASCSPSRKRLRPTPVHSASVTNKNAENTASTSSSSRSSPFDNFDYSEHWYPVVWARDAPISEPTKVTVFDVDYVVVRTSQDEVVCMLDKCPHKAASLSQGRVTETGNIQCSYHGWSFNGKTGECVDIPQITTSPGNPSAKIPSRACSTAVPAQVHQGMIWIFPGGGLEKALKADPPPTIAELEEPDAGFKMGTSIRDFPIDWPILISNICDPDHGPFAHQAKPFDMYTASTEFPMETKEEFPNDGKGWIIRSKVDASEKLLKVDETWRQDRGEKLKKSKGKNKESPWATTYVHAPNHVQMKRVDKKTGKANFLTTFFICPVGVGRSRFMSAAIGKAAVPRWLTKLFLDNFLDQDTYLLATQQQHILDQEARDLRALMTAQNGEAPKDISKATMPTRRKLFCLPSPTEKLGSRLEAFWDSTLLRSPNRIERLLQLHGSGAFASTPPREVVLDRKRQLLEICPDARDVVRNCKRVTFLGKWLGIGALAAKLILWSNKRVPFVSATSAACFVAAFLAHKLQKEYFFKYTDTMRQKDLSNIPKQIWVDK